MEAIAITVELEHSPKALFDLIQNDLGTYMEESDIADDILHFIADDNFVKYLMGQVLTETFDESPDRFSDLVSTEASLILDELERKYGDYMNIAPTVSFHFTPFMRSQVVIYLEQGI